MAERKKITKVVNGRKLVKYDGDENYHVAKGEK